MCVFWSVFDHNCIKEIIKKCLCSYGDGVKVSAIPNIIHKKFEKPSTIVIQIKFNNKKIVFFVLCIAYRQKKNILLFLRKIRMGGTPLIF